MITLTTERLRLVPPSLDYADDVFEYAADAVFCRYIDAEPARSVDAAVGYLEALMHANEKKRRLYWLVIFEGHCVGSLGFNFLYNTRHRTQDFGYGLAPRVWGKGVFSEAAQSVVKFGFGELGLDRIQATTRSDNTHSVNALLRLGFVLEGTLARFYETSNGRADCAVLALFNDL